MAAGVRTLDVCCGPGYVAGAAVSRGAVVCGVDIVLTMVALAARRCPEAIFQVGDASALPYPDRSLDAVVCNFGVEHISDPQTGVAELARVLRPGGRVAFSVWDEDRSRLDVVAESVYGSSPSIPTGIPSPPDLPEYASEEGAAPLLESAGLVLDRVETLSFTQQYPSADWLWDGWLAAAIRTRPVFEAQSADVQRTARTAYDAAIREWTTTSGRVDLPIAIRIIVARRV